MLNQFDDPKVTQILNSLLEYCQKKGGAAATLNYPSADSCIASQGLLQLWNPSNPPTDPTAANLEATYQNAKKNRDNILQQLKNLCNSMGGKNYKSGICSKSLIVTDSEIGNIWSPNNPSMNPQVRALEAQYNNAQNTVNNSLQQVAERCSALAPNNSKVFYEDGTCSAHPTKVIWSPSQPDLATSQLYKQLNTIRNSSKDLLSNNQVLVFATGLILILLILATITNSI